MIKYRYLLLCVCLVAGLAAHADRGGFYYKNFRVDAVVHRNNVWEITEKMDVIFEEPRHGIYRYVPLTFKLDHDVSGDEGMNPTVIQGQQVQDWRTFPYRSEVEDYSVEGWPYSTEDSEEDAWVIRIGDADKEVIGPQQYVLHYKYIYREDRRPNYDYLFHTILGTDFNERIENFSFRIEFEKPLPDDIEERIEVYSGAYGSTKMNVENLVVKANKNVITGRATDIAPNHGITLYAKLPEGYYEDVKSVNYVWHYIAFSVSVMLIVLIVFYLFKTKRPRPVKVIEFYPPDDICCAEVGIITDESVDSEDLASLIPWFAGKGYISIKEEASGGLLKKTETVLTKLKDLPDDAPAYQKKMMTLLFGNKQTANLSKMGEKPAQVKALKTSLENVFKGERALTYYSSPVFLYFFLMISTSCMFATNSVVQTFDFNEWIITFIIWTLPFCIGAGFRLCDSTKDLFGSTWKRVLVFVVKAAVMLFLCFIYCEALMEYGTPMSKWMVAAMFGVCFLLCELIGRFNIDTDYRLQMSGRLLGFREFIKTAEKPRLEALQQDDPMYFYKILPYAMVFGLSNKWANLFKDIDVEKPSWYDTATPLYGHAFTTHLASNLFESTNHAIQIVSHDSSSSSSGGSGGGGGFSGGGGGGGGGGSW